jgi:pimeloyl-ACP methyl ester carboxylesterase
MIAYGYARRHEQAALAFWEQLFVAYWKPGDHEAMFRSYLPRLEMQVLADVGHDPILEKPDAVNAALSSFLDRHFSGWKRRS